MVFSSLIFLFLFLVLNLTIYLCVKDKYKNIVLLVFSLIFYAWGGPKYLLLLVGETFASWFFALRIEKSENDRGRKLYMAGECVVLLGLLGYFKYAVFFLENFQMLFGVPEVIPNIVLPIGISFYTFQLLSYVVDVYRGEIHAQPAFWKLLLYSSLFHQCIAGPIVRYETVANEIDNRKVSQTDIYVGVRRFCIGLAKKAILANSCAEIADSLILPGSDALAAQSTLGLWLGMFAYMLQIYLDFSAYSDMAIGMGRMVGFRYLENFNYPYIAKSVKDFWRRWHISLSTFFRDYVYIPLGGSRCSTLKYIRNMTVVWFLTGMWHGASWNYIFWGLYYLVFLLLERFVIKDRIPGPLKYIYTLFVVFFGWVIFKFESLGELGSVLGGLFGIGTNGFMGMDVSTLFLSNIFLLIFAVVACTPLGKLIRQNLLRFGSRNSAVFTVFNITELIVPPLLLILSVLALIGNSYNPFLYFQF
ncbi:MAG: MBOAT family O-acyltransferase [Mediterraneibacter sp.]